MSDEFETALGDALRKLGSVDPAETTGLLATLADLPDRRSRWRVGGRLSWPVAAIGATAVAIVLALALASRPISTPGGSTPAISLQPRASAALSASDANIALTVGFDRSTIVSGGPIAASALVTNTSNRTITYQSDGCGDPITLTLAMPVPNEPSGLPQSGQDAKFKQFVLTKGFEQGGLPVLSPVPTNFGSVCQQPPVNLTLGPGQSVTAMPTWQAQLAGVAAPTGPINLTATFTYDPVPLPSVPPVSPGAPIPLRQNIYAHHVVASGTLAITRGGGPQILSAGEAVDAALRDPAFNAWLARQPQASWTVANLYVEDDGWHVELFVGEATFAYVILDPVSGKLRSMRICSPATCKL
jgi:hypothetical protein